MLLEAQQHHFSAFVVKDHYCPTMLSAYIAEKYVGDGSCRVFGGIALNNSVGGINLKAVDAAVAMGAKLVWMPTVSALRHKIMHSGKGVAFPASKGMSVAEKPIMYLQEDGSLQPQVLEVLDYLDGDEAGIKSASILIEGENAYGFLKGENGVHRLVRVSPFDANARRQTSFASLEVMPELDNTIQVDIRPEDIEMQVYRSSGAGGQHINKTSSAVRLIHKPTGIVVSCQTQRSQFQNRDYAMEMLKAKLYQIAKQQHMDKIDDIKGVQNEIAWGHQIRSYVFMPYTMVKDHRTNYETGNVDAVMDGDLDGFIFAYLKAASRGELQDT